MRVAIVQNAPAFGQVRANVKTAIEMMDAAGPFDLAVLPELFSTGYLFRDAGETAALAEPLPGGQAFAMLAAYASKRGIRICAGIAEEASGRLFNSAVLLGPSGMLAKYRKIHLFDTEKACFSPGDLPFTAADCGGFKAGIMICFDWIFPEAARTLALLGCSVILHPANLVFPYCPPAMATRAIENRVFTVTANRVGEERGRKFSGGSVIWSPRMENILTCPDAEGAFVAEIEPAEAESKNITGRNNLFEDRRPEMYGL